MIRLTSSYWKCSTSSNCTRTSYVCFFIDADRMDRILLTSWSFRYIRFLFFLLLLLLFRDLRNRESIFLYYRKWDADRELRLKMINVYCKNNGIIGMIRSICINYIVNLFNLKLYIIKLTICFVICYFNIKEDRKKRVRLLKIINIK